MRNLTPFCLKINVHDLTKTFNSCIIIMGWYLFTNIKGGSRSDNQKNHTAHSTYSLVHFVIM